ncbi:MAG: MBL fold metallo-hydrolase [Tannerellaceae bacterium]|nr:MBL fold metallo-hydrolase [Tannerellaceae bacterium]
MKLTYIFHSGFAIETDDCTILIDYFKDSGVNPDEGYVHDVLLKKEGPLYILSSHFHADHFNPEILKWKEVKQDITYLFSKDILKRKRASKQDAVYLKKLETYQDDHLYVKAFGSTDVGVSFLLEIAGKKIFHAGDLNNWHWKDESTEEEVTEAEQNYLTELKLIADAVDRKLDVAMFPVDPRMGTDYMRGAEQFVDEIRTSVFAPMHFEPAIDQALAFESYARSKGCCFFEITYSGESIII